MSITFISLNRLAITAVVLAVAVILYFWRVRPILAQYPRFHDAFERNDTRFAGVVCWLKERWDIATAFLIALTPILWNGSLDLIVAVSNILPMVSGVDLSGALMPAWLKTTIQILGALLPVIRAQILRSRGAEE